MAHSQKAIGIMNLKNETVKFRNFKGEGGKFNKKGDRNFKIVLDDATADDLENQGFYIKHAVRNNGEVEHQLKINVKMDSQWPPEIKVFTKNGDRDWGADEIGNLDDAMIIGGEVWFNGYQSPNSDHKTAWLDEMIVAIQDNVNYDKYRALFDAPAGEFIPDPEYMGNERMPLDE